MMKELLMFVGFISLMISYNKDKNISDTTDTQITITIDFNDRKQQIMAFGASDAWGCHFTGKNWPVNKREKIAELLFSNDIDTNGNPKGIGLSGWRFNIGEGSTEQAINIEIEDEWRRAECFLNNDGTFNWEKQQGQRWFMKAASIQSKWTQLFFNLSGRFHVARTATYFITYFDGNKSKPSVLANGVLLTGR